MLTVDELTTEVRRQLALTGHAWNSKRTCEALLDLVLATYNPIPIAAPALPPAPVVIWPYTALQAELTAGITAVMAALESVATVPDIRHHSSASVTYADSNRQADLLTPTAPKGVAIQLTALKAAGASVVSIAIHTPLLCSMYPQSVLYRAFYQAVVNQARALGLAVQIKNNFLFSDPAYGAGFNYASYTTAQLMALLQEQSVWIAANLKPDYLTLCNEPETMIAQTGKAFTIADYTSYVSACLNACDRSRTLIGAGTGSWENRSWWNAFMALSVDYGDIHIYPVVGPSTNFMLAAISMTDYARQYKRRVIIGESGLYKQAAAEYSASVTTSAVYLRDVYQNFAAEDSLFERALWLLAQKKGIELVNHFWSRSLFAYLPYDATTAVHTYATGSRAVEVAALANMQAGTMLSPTGRAWQAIAAEKAATRQR